MIRVKWTAQCKDLSENHGVWLCCHWEDMVRRLGNCYEDVDLMIEEMKRGETVKTRLYEYRLVER